MGLTGKGNGRPRVACEISAGQIFVARAAERAPAIEVLLSRGVPEQAVVPSLINQNIADPDAVRAVLGDMLSAAAGRSRDITLVIPDASVRVTLLDFDVLPEKKADADQVVRFRLKKTLPFDVEKAAISYHVDKVGAELKLVVAVMLGSILEEYESVVRNAGYVPGVVMPSTLAALGNVEGDAPTMAVKVTPVSTTMAIVNENALFLYRTLDTDLTNVGPEALAEAIYPSLVFFQDTCGAPVSRVLLSGVEYVESLGELLSGEMGIQAGELTSPAFHDVNAAVNRTQLAGLLGALV